MLVIVGRSSMTTAKSVSDVVDWSTLHNIIESESSGADASAINSALNVAQRQTSQMTMVSDSYDVIAEQSQRIRDQMDGWKSAAAAAAAAAPSFEYEYLKEASAAALANASPQQLQLIGDVVSMLSADYAYDAAQREMELHEDCIAAALDDLDNATKIIVATASAQVDAEYSQQMQRVAEYVLSAVRHLQDSCPLCQALKYAAGEIGQNLLPFVTVLCSSVLKMLHPSASSAPL